MNFLHYKIDLNTGDCVQVKLDKQANVRLLDHSNFQHYKKGQKHQYFGGLATRTPYTITAPRAGSWHLVIDLGGYSGQVSASVSII